MADFQTIITYNGSEKQIDPNSLATMSCNGQLMATAVTVKTPEIIPTVLTSDYLEASRPTSGTGSGAGEILIKAINNALDANSIFYIEGSDGATTTVNRAVNLQTIDTNFIAENIRFDKKLFGVQGTYSGTQYETYLGGIAVGSQFVITGDSADDSTWTVLNFTSTPTRPTWYAWCQSAYNENTKLTCDAENDEAYVFWGDKRVLYTAYNIPVCGRDYVEVANYFCKDLAQS